MSLCPAPSTHSGSTAFEHFSWMLSPCEKSITSSSVPWITNTGDVIFDTLSMLGNTSKNHVRLVLGKATRIPLIRAECSTTAPTS